MSRNGIRSLSNFIRLDESDYEQFDVHEGMESTLTLLDHELRDRITVHRYYGDIPDIYGYPARLIQVFMNLLTHDAIQFEPDTGEIISTVGQGTTFILKLPIYPTSSILPEPPLTPAATVGGG